MEKLRRTWKAIAYAQNQAKLSKLHRSLIPFLSFASSLNGVTLSFRHYLYRLGFFPKSRLPVPVISVGNLARGGNEKPPMVAFISQCLDDFGILHLILMRGYVGIAEFKMLLKHLPNEPIEFRLSRNTATLANWFFEDYGYVDSCCSKFFDRAHRDKRSHISSEKIGASILYDGMQHWSVCRDLEIVMINGLMPWGNGQLIPLGPLREPLIALKRADIVVVHHADLVAKQKLKDIELVIREINDSLPIFYTQMAPSFFFDVRDIDAEMHLEVVHNAVVLCVSAIGSADAFVQGIEKIGPIHVDRFDFSDHHAFQTKDICMMRERLRRLEDKFGYKPIVIVKEKDYDRDWKILKQLHPFQVLVLCSKMQIIPRKGYDEDHFKLLLKQFFAGICYRGNLDG